MLIMEVEYLTGRVVATDREMRNQVEWPPHPQRLFSALAAAYFECDLGEAAKRALQWLEELPPPALAVPDAHQRDVLPVYVPVNDSATPATPPKQIVNGLRALPEKRIRQERFFPTMIPETPVVQFLWKDVAAGESEVHRSALEQIASEVSYLGHSTSLVRVSIVDAAREATLCPCDSETQSRVEMQLRTLSPGRLELLQQRYVLSLENHRRMEAPDVPRTGYMQVKPTLSIASTVFGGEDDWFVFEPAAGSRKLPLTSGLALTISLRKALMDLCDDPIPEVLSGHSANGTPTDLPHVAFIPLAHVGHQYADGLIHGCAVVLPKNLTKPMRNKILLALGRLRKVWNNEKSSNLKHLAFDWQLNYVAGAQLKKTLQSETYIYGKSRRPSRYWSTVTPVVFGHFLRKKDDGRAKKIIKECCQAIGLPEPLHFHISETSMLPGVPLSSHFPSLSSQGKPVWVRHLKSGFCIPRKLDNGAAVRMRYHVTLEFKQPVQGPVILGAGRYLGMGLFRSIPDHLLAK